MFTNTIKQFAILSLALSVTAIAATSYEMQRVCKDKVSQRYKVSRASIYTAVPRQLYGRYSVYGKTPKNTENALYFVCDFNKRGRFVAVKTEKDLRRNNNRPSKPTRAAKHACKGEASSVWRVSQRDVRIENIRPVNAGRYKITIEARNRSAVCDVNAQGNIYSFKVRNNHNAQHNRKKIAKQACRRLASRLWKVPVSRTHINRLHKNTYRRGRYDIEVGYRHIRGKCEVDVNGYVHHFRTLR